MFQEFLLQGFLHILDLNGLDHLLFLLVLGIVYDFKHWKQLLWVLTAFTIAHSITLALALFEVFSLETSWVEFFIPCTILFTCLENVMVKHHQHKTKVMQAGIFGLIHGMGFSTLLKDLFLGMDYSPWLTLLPFNLGIELAQIVIIGILLFLMLMIQRWNLLAKARLVQLVSAVVGIQALIWMIDGYPF